MSRWHREHPEATEEEYQDSLASQADEAKERAKDRRYEEGEKTDDEKGDTDGDGNV